MEGVSICFGCGGAPAACGIALQAGQAPGNVSGSVDTELLG